MRNIATACPPVFRGNASKSKVPRPLRDVSPEFGLLFLVVVGTHFALLLIAVKWLKSKSTQLLKFDFLLPVQRQPSFGRSKMPPHTAETQSPRTEEAPLFVGSILLLFFRGIAANQVALN